jgi:RecA/RadA recombinase
MDLGNALNALVELIYKTDLFFQDIDSLLDRIVFPKMLLSIPSPQRASDLLQSAKNPATISTGWHQYVLLGMVIIADTSPFCFSETDFLPSTVFRSLGSYRIDRLLGGGWRSGEVSEICSSDGSGKTDVCLHSAIELLLQDRTAQVIWIDAHSSGGFSAQHASDVSRIRIQQQQPQQTDGQDIEVCSKEIEVFFIQPHPLLPSPNLTLFCLQDVITSVLSRIQVFVCQDVYEILEAIEVLEKRMYRSITVASDPVLVPKLLVIDSLARAMNGVLRIPDGVGKYLEWPLLNDRNDVRFLCKDPNPQLSGHATMMHTMRELKGLAQEHALTALVWYLVIIRITASCCLL